MFLQKYLHKYKWDFLCLGLLTLTIPLFFYKLGQSSLTSWDEAWYADIARTIVKTGDLINLKWNGIPYLDHPPFGYWVAALTFKIFGVNEFWARFPQAVSALVCLYFVYFLGKKLFSPLVGLVCALVLSSTPWFVNRARSGNLDILLTLLIIINLYSAFKAIKNQKYLLPLSFSLIALLLTKTMVPLVIIPSLIIILGPKNLVKKAWKYLLISLLVFLGWLIYNIAKYPHFLSLYLDVGLRGVQPSTNYLANILLTKTYLYNGIGKWFWPGMMGFGIAIFLRQKRLLVLLFFVSTFLLPFVFSPKVQIWHLIPLYPFLILSFFGGFWVLLERYLYSKRYVLFGLIIILSSYFYLIQIRQIWYQIVDIPSYTSDEAILSREASKYPQKLLTDGDFDPAAAFYSEKVVYKIKRDQLKELFQQVSPFLLITNDWRLSESKIPSQSYQLIKKDRDKVLVLH